MTVSMVKQFKKELVWAELNCCKFFFCKQGLIVALGKSTVPLGFPTSQVPDGATTPFKLREICDDVSF